MFNGACETVFVIGQNGPMRINKTDFDPAIHTECDETGKTADSEPESGTFGVIEQDGRWFVTTASGSVSKAKRFDQTGYETEIAAWTATAK